MQECPEKYVTVIFIVNLPRICADSRAGFEMIIYVQGTLLHWGLSAKAACASCC